MFLVNKYYNNSNKIAYHKTTINKIINTFDNYYKLDVNSLMKLPHNEFIKVLNNLEYGTWRYSNFQHLIIYGSNGSGKEFIVTKLLENIYGKSGIELKEIEYVIPSYSNTKTKVMIKQSKNHIIIEPNLNGLDKYLIQEIIKDYAKSELLNILKNKKLFKIIVINKIDNLSYYAQTSLRRTMEKYSNTCKFILISEQLCKIIEPLRSRCLMIRIPLPSEEQIFETLLHISIKEKIDMSGSLINKIIKKSKNNINHAIWLLEMSKYNINYDINWENVINNIVKSILNLKPENKYLYNFIKNIREQFYILFITNIPTQLIIRKIMIKLLQYINDMEKRYNIINITSTFEERLNQGTRHIIHIEAYIIKLLDLLHNK
jgi:replication factor C subunit 3/5